MNIRLLSGVVVVAAVSGFLLTGCGGGGGTSNPISSSIPSAATDSNSSLDAAVSRAYSPNYATVIQNDGTWSSHSIAVYVPSADDYAIADVAMRRWEQSTDNYFQFTRVASANQAQITFQRVSPDSFDAGVVGKTTYTFDTGSKALTSAQVRIAGTGTDTQQTIVAIHELGHALGIHGHSTDNDDAMYYAPTVQNAITERDLNTLFWLYGTASSTGRAAGTTETRTIDCKQ